MSRRPPTVAPTAIPAIAPFERPLGTVRGSAVDDEDSSAAVLVDDGGEAEGVDDTPEAEVELRVCDPAVEVEPDEDTRVVDGSDALVDEEVDEANAVTALDKASSITQI